MMVTKKIIKYLNSPTSILPLAIFRMAFGFLMAFSMMRFIYKGWIEDAYVNPVFHFTYQNFEWVQPFGVVVMYALVIGCTLSALCIGLGVFYRWATIFFFVSFTYLELIEKSWYLNHYYFVSLIAFLLIWIPANKSFSFDARLRPRIKRDTVPMWTVVAIKVQLSIVYFFGGIAKLNSDWLLDANPLRIWLRARTDIPWIGSFFEYEITPYLFSWSGMLYDLLIPFLLWSKRTRPIAYILVIVFHVLTYVLFNIGMFPWLMIFGSLIFITEQEWRSWFRLPPKSIREKQSIIASSRFYFVKVLFLFFFFIQCTFPLRHFFLTDNVLWTENGFRFSWHVMVMEKNGYVTYVIKDQKNGKQWIEYPTKRLSSVQEKQMSFQPDMIWQYAQYLKKTYQDKGIENPEIYVNVKVSLNGRPSQTMIPNDLDLARIERIDSIYDFVISLD